MQIQITGKHIKTGESLRAYVEERFAAAISRYFERGADVHITFSRQAHNFFRADCAVHLDSGLRIQATGDADDIYVSFDKSLTKIEKQLRRYKRRLKNHHNRNNESSEKILGRIAVEHTLEAEPEDIELPEDYQPVTIAENPVHVPELSVSEAVMQMELAHAAFLIFRNAAHGELNIVHRRDDGHIGWIDPAHKAATTDPKSQ